VSEESAIARAGTEPTRTIVGAATEGVRGVCATPPLAYSTPVRVRVDDVFEAAPDEPTPGYDTYTSTLRPDPPSGTTRLRPEAIAVVPTTGYETPLILTAVAVPEVAVNVSFVITEDAFDELKL
jgi:hypothetical protein